MLIRVFQIAAPDGKFCFGSGNPRVFIELDWFHDEKDGEGSKATPEDVIEFVKGKSYYKKSRSLLILTEQWCRTINYHT